MSMLPCHGRARWYGREREGVGGSNREELRLAEIELMRQRERVAELRRHLPQGAPIQDYQFEEGPCDLDGGDAPLRTVRLSELFTKRIARSSSIT
jgi:predicted dithiol-disulfide oxidoreductase (DUF899 family)